LDKLRPITHPRTDEESRRRFQALADHLLILLAGTVASLGTCSCDNSPEPTADGKTKSLAQDISTTGEALMMHLFLMHAKNDITLSGAQLIEMPGNAPNIQ
jgi:hypothetical protein